MRKLLCMMVLSTVGFMPLEGLSQLAAKLSAKTRGEVVNAIGKRLVEQYVYEDTAVKMSSYLRQKLAKGAYDKINDPVLFAETLLADLRSVYTDGHLLIQYNP